MEQQLKALASIFGIAYPLVFYFGNKYLGTEVTAILLALVILVNLLISRRAKDLSNWIYFAMAVLTFTGIVIGSSNLTKLYPLAINSYYLWIFVYSIISPPSMIEQFAALRYGEIPADAKVYLKKLTKVWIAFLCVNGLIILYTSLFMSDRAWMLYTGFISYVLIGCLFFGEIIFRKIFIKV